jgi:hypothetical protein
LAFFLGSFGANFTLANRVLSTECEPETIARKFVATLKNSKDAAWLGRQYLKCMPGEADIYFLLRSLTCNSKVHSNAMRNLDIQSLRRYLNTKQCEEYDSGRIFNLNGWILSRSEARIYALAALVI